MFHRKFFLSTVCAVLLAVWPTRAQNENAGPKLKFLEGPTTAKLGGVAQVQVPEKCIFYDGNATRELMKAMGDPISGKELGLLAPEDRRWSVFFEFNDIGYVKDDEKNKLDGMADKLLQSYKESAVEQNKERARMGTPALEIVGWEQPPHYDETSHNLTWAIRCSVLGRPILNYNTRLLGRLGVMEVILVVQPDRLESTLPEFKNLLAGYSFQTGNNYAEYRKGDKVAKYGLAALVLGGAAVGAAKLGLLAWLLPFLKKGWILIVAAFAGIASFFRKLFGRKDERPNDGSST